MGAIECEVKVLSKSRPLLFTWENPTKRTVECVLVTCHCQRLNLGDKDAPGGPGAQDQQWVPNLVRALEKSEVYSFNSIEPCDSLINHIKVANDVPFCPDSEEDLKGLPRKLKEKYRKRLSRARKKGKLKVPETKDVVTDDAAIPESEFEVGDTAGSEPESTQAATEEPATVNAGTGACGEGEMPTEGGNSEQSEVSVDMQHPIDVPGEEMASYVGGEEGASDVEGETATGAGSEVVVIGTTDFPPETQDCKVNPADRSDPVEGDDTADDHSDLPEQSYVEGTDLGEPVISSNEDVAEVIVGGDNPPLENSQIDIVPLEGIPVLPTNIQQTPESSSLSADSALLKAINSIMVMQMNPTSEESLVSQLISEQTLNESIPQQPEYVTKPQDPDAPATNVEFIRPLTEEERQKMFTFKEDRERKNLEGLREARKNVFLCEYCGKVLTKSTRKKHMETHRMERERQHVCDRCGKGFFTSYSLKNHMKIHDPSRKGHQCRYCSKSYKTVYGRTIHERLHFGVYSSTCEKCGRKFSDNRVSRNHAEICRGPGNRRRHRARREKVQLQPGDDGTIQCSICSKVLRVGSYRAHLDMHEGRMFTCHICGKIMKFSTRTSHLYIHKATKDFPCNYCEKAFKTKQGRDVHERVHTGERPHKCRYCERTFGRYSSREVHEGTHTNDRPYKCTICNKSWKDRSSYWLHMKKNHPGEPLIYKRLTARMNSKQGNQFFVDTASSDAVSTEVVVEQQWQSL